MREMCRLEKDEELLWVKHPCIIVLLYNIVPVLVGLGGLYFIFYYAGFHNLIYGLIIIAVGVFIFLVLLLGWLRTKYFLTTKKVASQIGLMGIKYEEVGFADVQSVDRVQTFWGMIFGYGTLVVEAAGNNNNVKFESISKVKEVEKQVSQLSNL